MNRRLEIDLMRLLHGELPPDRARELTARMAREPEVAERYRRLEEGWQGLAAPPAAPAPAGFAGRVMAHVRSGAEETGATLSWSLAPTWVRAAAALALVAGLALGAGLGRTPAPVASPPSLSMVAGPPEGLGASFWTLVEDATAPAPATPEAAAGAPR